MAKQLNVYPECYVDTSLVSYLLAGCVKHKSSCNEVVKALNNSDTFAIGIIDADKRMPTIDPGFKEYELDEKVDGEKRHIRLYIHNDNRRFLFTVYKAMDSFIFHAAIHQQANMEAFGNAQDVDEFLKYTKSVQSGTDPKLRRLYGEIDDYPEMMRFRNTLKYLMAKLYEVDIEIVKRFFDGRLEKEDLHQYLKF